MKTVLMVVGSLRKNSFNLQLARAVEAMLDGKVQVKFLEFADLPFMNQDLEIPTPEHPGTAQQPQARL